MVQTMPTPSEKLAQSLEALRLLQSDGLIAIRSSDLSRVHRERLTKNGFLQEVIKGWYIPTRPDDMQGESTAWYTSFWEFCSSYLNQRFGELWCLSPEQSLLLHAENWNVPKQLLVRSPKAHNKIIYLPFNTALLDAQLKMPNKADILEKNRIKIFSLKQALLGCSPKFFIQYPTEARTILAMFKDASDILPELLDGGHSTIASRLVGAFRNIGKENIAEDIKKTMISAGYDIREQDPFEYQAPILFSDKTVSPYVNRMRILWGIMREQIIERFPKSSNKKINIENYLKKVDENYVTDAYHSLSIEGYRVSRELIEKVSTGRWNPDGDDRDHKNALAARGYWQAFEKVKESIHKVLEGENSGEVASKDHRDWFRELFAPSVTAGILKPSDLAGYRRSPVYIRCSMHTPPGYEAVRDLMPAFFEMLTEEKDVAVRIVLGHFFFVFIHPYLDGNGRIGRFLMNVICASGGYPWIIIPLEKRETYMNSLEEASVRQNIVPFCNFILSLLERY